MRRIQGLVLAGLSLALTLPAAAETASQVFRQVSPSVVVVVTYDAEGKPAELGSGVMLPNHDVATNCHVLKDGTQYRVRYRDKEYVARLDKSDWDHDVCSLVVPNLPAPSVVFGDTKNLQVGAPVYAIGAPEGLQLTLSEGIVSSLRPVNGGSYIQTTAAISPGSSGGGLFDEQGRLLGLTSFFMSQGQQLNFALPVEWIEELPQRSTQPVVARISEVDWLNHAVDLETRKQWNELITLAERWTKTFPDSDTSWMVLGEAYSNAGRPMQAIAANHRALRINPRDAEIWNNLGADYADAGQATQAIDAFRHALLIKPQYSMVWDNLGRAYASVGQYEEAIDALLQGSQINPRDENIWYNLGVVYAETKQSPQAIDAYIKALQIDPQNEDAWLNVGVINFGSGQYADAIYAYRQALQVKPNDADAWNDLGAVYGATNRYTQAIEAYRQAIRINPQEAKSWYGLGLAYVQTDQKDQAITAYQQLKRLSPQLAQQLFDMIVPK